uniref:Ig-like domain-containing protein n=1 Tax=Erpetoichthys calabaricus TaxID=27687 RepID=A0A8C4T8N9_ERPCA
SSVFHQDSYKMIQALTGSCLVIPCTFTSPQRHSYLVGIWRMNHYWFGVDVFKESQSLENWSGLKVAIIGDLQLRNCTTHPFFRQCAETRLTLCDFLNLNFSVLPPRCSTLSIPVKEGESTSLTCSAPLFCPKQPPSLAWSDTLNGTVHQTVHTGIKESRSVSSRLTFTASFHLHMKNITCTVSYPVETEKRSAAQSLTLNVLCKISSSLFRELHVYGKAIMGFKAFMKAGQSSQFT